MLPRIPKSKKTLKYVTDLGPVTHEGLSDLLILGQFCWLSSRAGMSLGPTTGSADKWFSVLPFSLDLALPTLPRGLPAGIAGPASQEVGLVGRTEGQARSRSDQEPAASQDMAQDPEQTAKHPPWHLPKTFSGLRCGP